MANRMKVVILLLVLMGLIFAEEVALDSLQNYNSLKRQKLFFAAEQNWIPPTLPDESGCLGVGCCLFSAIGLIGIYKVNKENQLDLLPDTVKVYKKWQIGFTYNFNVCYTGRYFSRNKPETFPSPLDFLYFLYGLNSIEGGLSYRVRPRWLLEWQVGYGWADLKDRQTGDWKVEKFSTSFRKREYLKSLMWCWGIEFNYAKAYSASNVIKKCFGPGLLFSIEFRKPDAKEAIHIVPFFTIRLSTTFDYLPLSGASGFKIIFSGIGGGLTIRK